MNVEYVVRRRAPELLPSRDKQAAKLFVFSRPDRPWLRLTGMLPRKTK
jgi:hypothetical protein